MERQVKSVRERDIKMDNKKLVQGTSRKRDGETRAQLLEKQIEEQSKKQP